MHTIIVPGVGGSGEDHWQTWLQRQLMSSSRVQQLDWNYPLLSDWVQQFLATIDKVNEPIQIVAHSFGCLTSVAALHQHPNISDKIKNLVLVAPANPSRFGDQGFARNSHNDYSEYFHNIQLKLPTTMLISENDPWLDFTAAQKLARAWKVRPINLGQVGHINVESGFGPFPEIFDHLVSDKLLSYISNIDDTKLYYKFAF